MARPIVRKLTKRIFVIVNISISIFLLLACTNNWLHPDEWWFIAVLGLAFPFLLLLTIFFLFFWLFFRSRWAFLPIVCLLLAIPNINALLAFHFKKKFESKKAKDSFRILTWNVMWFDEQKKKDKSQKSQRQKMMQYIGQQDADILCFQEFLESDVNDSERYNNQEELVRMGYPYRYIVGDYAFKKGVYHAGVAIFSRFPIKDSFRLQYPGPASERAAESLIAADIDIYGRKVRIFTTHLQSLRFQEKDYKNIQIIRNAQDSMVDASKSILRKLRKAYSLRGYQADLVRQRLDESPFPEIICGDFNDVPNSYTYFHIKGDRQDAFSEKGTGIGRTFSNLSPTLRIDYILADKAFNVLQYKKNILPYSDHFPVLADLELTKDNE